MSYIGLKYVVVMVSGKFVDYLLYMVVVVMQLVIDWLYGHVGHGVGVQYTVGHRLILHTR